jgi:EH domain-containing protein 1
MDRETYINALRVELLEMVEKRLTPISLRYGYSDVPLETNIKWRPLVLVLGNYSSGKSALINEFLGADIQATGQAPTDDSFTVITHDDTASPNSSIRVHEERDGKFLLNDPEYPFETLKKHGQRFSSHFRLKKVNSPFLRTLAVIDTPGMLDSISEKDRGYNYQEVVGDLAQIADLILVLFDPHKAGTIREAHISLRDTLPLRTFEDRVLFVLNRIDECASLIDLLRVYGTLCWNLSQITGRKDIPTIHLTYSPKAAAPALDTTSRDISFLPHLENQREHLRKAILEAPRHRLDHLAAFVETHSERLSHFLEALVGYRRWLRSFRFKRTVTGILASLFVGVASAGAMTVLEPFAGMGLLYIAGIAGGIATAVFVLWMTLMMKMFTQRFHRERLHDLDNLTLLDTQTRRDSWEAIEDMVHIFLEQTEGKFSLSEAKRDLDAVNDVYRKGAREIREAMYELSTLREKGPGPYLSSIRDAEGTGASVVSLREKQRF